MHFFSFCCYLNIDDNGLNSFKHQTVNIRGNYSTICMITIPVELASYSLVFGGR